MLLRVLYSRRIHVTLESVETFNPRETSLVSSSGLSTFVSSVKREFFLQDSRFHPPSINSHRPLTRIRVRKYFFSSLLPTILIINIYSIASQLLKLLSKYSPETKKEKKVRLLKEAEGKAKDPKAKDAKKTDKKDKPVVLKFGLNHVTELVEQGKAKLVAIAHDVDPIEMMVYLPALCRKKGIPYAFVKGKVRLGKLVHQKTATCVALVDSRKEDY
jgi:ribosomal protein L7Ae-like RNA K-turn-binding protein